MSFLKTFFATGIILIPLAFYLQSNIDQQEKINYSISFSVKLRKVILYIDDILRLFNFKGFYRYLESFLSEYSFKNVDRSNLKVEIANFDGVEAIIFDPIKNPINRPAIIYVHGGGWASLSPKFYANMTAELAIRLNQIVISLNYRKAPEFPFPAGFNDVHKAIEYLFNNADSPRFNINRDRIALMGDSAGGNLVVAVGHHMMSRFTSNNNKGHRPKIIVPICPLLQAADFDLPSYRDNIQDLILGKNDVLNFVCKYALGFEKISECMESLGSNSHLDQDTLMTVKPNVDWTIYLHGKGYDNRPKSRFNRLENGYIARMSELAMNPHFSPLSALNDTQLALLPPMFIFATSGDPLRDDAKLLAARLTKLKRPNQYIELDGFHSPFILAQLGLKSSLEAFDKLVMLFRNNAIL